MFMIACIAVPGFVNEAINWIVQDLIPAIVRGIKGFFQK